MEVRDERVDAPELEPAAGQGLSERKILRELQISGAGSATRY